MLFLIFLLLIPGELTSQSIWKPHSSYSSSFTLPLSFQPAPQRPHCPQCCQILTKPNRINTLWLLCIYAPVVAFPLRGEGLGISDCFFDHMVTPSLSLSIHDVQKTFTFCSFPTPKVSPVLSQMLCKIQQAFITPGMFRWFIRQYHLPFTLPETCAADILQGNACSFSPKGWWQALEIRWAGFLVLDGGIMKERRKKTVVCWSLLQQTSPCAQYSWSHEPWFPGPLPLSTITHTFLAAAVPAFWHDPLPGVSFFWYLCAEVFLLSGPDTLFLPSELG